MNGFKAAAGAGLLAVLLATAPVVAHEPALTTNGPARASSALSEGSPGAFDRLPSGDQRMAETIFFAQDPDAEGVALWSLDRIATANQRGTAWDTLCRQFHDRGLMTEEAMNRILGNVVRQTRADLASPTMAGRGAPPEAIPGAFERMSARDRRFAEAIFDAQKPEAGGATVWSLGQLATARQAGRKWRKIYSELHDRGLVASRDLGRTVSRFQRRPRTVVLTGEMVVTTGSGHVMYVGGNAKRRTRGKAGNRDIAFMTAEGRYGSSKGLGIVKSSGEMK